MYKIEKMYRDRDRAGNVVGPWRKARHWLYEKEKTFEIYWKYRVNENLDWHHAIDYKLDAYKNDILIRSCKFVINDKGYIEAIITVYPPADEDGYVEPYNITPAAEQGQDS